jgi:hypothetical protein
MMWQDSSRRTYFQFITIEKYHHKTSISEHNSESITDHAIDFSLDTNTISFIQQQNFRTQAGCYPAYEDSMYRNYLSTCQYSAEQSQNMQDILSPQNSLILH